mmetsp:Transcript_52260/g.67019  ORF Transcript_52260/g.67019 Transcript_52260/m.67019 type:complete len:309 (+) Transcript_52260:2-928(+)
MNNGMSLDAWVGGQAISLPPERVNLNRLPEKRRSQKEAMHSKGSPPLPHPTSSRNIPKADLSKRQQMRSFRESGSPKTSSSFDNPFISESRGGSAAPLIGNSSGAHKSFLPGLLNSNILNNKIHQTSSIPTNTLTPKKSIDNFMDPNPTITTNLPGTILRSPVVRNGGNGGGNGGRSSRPISRSPMTPNNHKNKTKISRGHEGPWSDGPRGMHHRPDTSNQNHQYMDRNPGASRKSLPVAERMEALYGNLNDDSETPRPPTATGLLVDRFNLAPSMRPSSRRASRGIGGHVSPEHIGDILTTCAPLNR